MFFPDEPLNDKDILFLELRSRFELLKRPSGSADALIAKSLSPTKDTTAGETLLGWDIVLVNG